MEEKENENEKLQQRQSTTNKKKQIGGIDFFFWNICRCSLLFFFRVCSLFYILKKYFQTS